MPSPSPPLPLLRPWFSARRAFRHAPWRCARAPPPLLPAASRPAEHSAQTSRQIRPNHDAGAPNHFASFDISKGRDQIESENPTHRREHGRAGQVHGRDQGVGQNASDDAARGQRVGDRMPVGSRTRRQRRTHSPAIPTPPASPKACGRAPNAPPAMVQRSSSRSVLYGAFFFSILLAVVVIVAGIILIASNQTMTVDTNRAFRDALSVLLVTLPGLFLLIACFTALRRDPVVDSQKTPPIL